MFARVRLQGSADYQALLLPDEAIGTDQTNKYVYVVGDDGRSERRTCELGPLVEGLRVVRKGIGPDDWVVIRGQQRVRPGPEDRARSASPLTVSDAARRKRHCRRSR